MDVTTRCTVANGRCSEVNRRCNDVTTCCSDVSGRCSNVSAYCSYVRACCRRIPPLKGGCAGSERQQGDVLTHKSKGSNKILHIFQ
jgi:hypothetical protein